MKRDFAALFAGLPDRTKLQGLLRRHQPSGEQGLGQTSVMTVMDSDPIELTFPIRPGRSEQQVGQKNKDKGRWSMGIQLCGLVNRFGQGGWQ